MAKVYDFQSFLLLKESSGSGINIIIGDSQTPYVAKRSQNVKMLSSKGSKSALWLGGMGLSWLKGAVKEYPTNQDVSNVVICIGTNGGFNPKEDIAGLFKELKRAFPKARFYAVQGSWGWGGNKNVTLEKVKAYYYKFSLQGATVIEPPIGSVSDPHGHLPVYVQIGKNIDLAITNKSAPVPILISPKSDPKPQTSQDSDSQNKPSDVEHFQDWLDINHPGWAWGYDGGIVNRTPGYGRFGPRTTKAWSNYKDEYLKNGVGVKFSESPVLASGFLLGPKKEQPEVKKDQNYQSYSGKDPEKTDPNISSKYNFHIIPDGKNSNYRSAQFTPDIMREMYKKYGIKNVIRFNGDGKDSVHIKGETRVSISEEKAICDQIGCNFYKMSSTRDQEKVNKLLEEGNTLVHCAHGADRTGGNIGGYLYKTKANSRLTTTESIWNYTTQYNEWNWMALNKPDLFKNWGYLEQAQKFGVRDFSHALQLASKK